MGDQPMPDGPGWYRVADEWGDQVAIVEVWEHVDDGLCSAPMPEGRRWMPDPYDPTCARRVLMPEEEDALRECMRVYSADSARRVDAERERDALASELAAMRGDDAPDGWTWQPDTRTWLWEQGDHAAEVHVDDRSWTLHDVSIEHRPVLAASEQSDQLTGPDGAFVEARRGLRGIGDWCRGG